MSRASGHFCPHGNLRYSCPLCRKEREEARGPIVRKTYGRPLGPDGAPPGLAWRLDDALRPHEEEAVRAAAGRDGVVSIPAALGLRRVAFVLLRALRIEADALVFLVPSHNAREAWLRTLADEHGVPGDEIDDAGRAVRDWSRLRPILLWTPEAAERNLHGARAEAARLALFVDSPESERYERLAPFFAMRWKRRLAVAATRLLPPEAGARARLDALGGVLFHLDLATAHRRGLTRRVDWRAVVASGPTPDESAAEIVGWLGAAGAGRSLVILDDEDVGRAVESRAARAGHEPRLVGGAADADAARRAAETVAAGGARVLVRVLGAPEADPGPVATVVVAAPSLSALRGGGLLMSQAARGEGALRWIEVIPERAPLDATVARAAAERVLAGAATFGVAVPPVGWFASALPVPSLPAALAAAVTRENSATWSAVQLHLPALLQEGWDEETAAAALADAWIAARLGVPAVALGPVARGASDDAGLLRGIPACEALPVLALLLPEARPAFSAFLRRDVAGFLHHWTASALLHHLAPDARRCLVATLEMLHGRPTLDADDPLGAARAALSRGKVVKTAGREAGAMPSDPLAAQPHLERLLAGLEAEKALEIDESVDEIARLSGPERARLGRTLLGLLLASKTRTPSGIELRFAPASPGEGRTRPLLPYTEISTGSLVDVSAGVAYDKIVRGVVTAVEPDEIALVVADDDERRAPAREARLDVVGNPRVYDTLARSVRIVYGPGELAPGAGARGLVAHLLARTPAAPAAAGEFVPFDPGLNRSQAQAVGRALAGAPVSLLHGPPGTGKTTTLVELIRQEVARGHRVLVAADSNAAVDAILDAYVSAGGVGVRTGPRPSLTRAHLARHHIDTLRARAPGVDWLRRLPAVFTTHVSSAALPRDLTFDLVVQDEASQATEPASCVSLSRAPRLVLAGDHLQLPPVVRSGKAVELGLDVSLFERLQRVYGAFLSDLLSVQYRMHRDIEAWSNREFYGGKIETAVDPEALAPAVLGGLLSASRRALFVDVAGAERSARTSKEREPEALWTAAFVRALLAAGVRASQVAVITAYRAQVRLLRPMLDGTGVDVGTIDAFQGSERDVVIVSLVRGNPRGEVGFVRDPRRLNVAVTRARRHLVVVGDRATLASEPILLRLLDALLPWDPPLPS